MDFEDFFENKKRRYYADSHKDMPHYNHHSKFNPLAFLYSLRNNKKLRMLIIIGIVILLVVIIVLIMLLFPLIQKLINYIEQNGISGLIDVVMGYLNKLWYGAK